MNFFGFATPWAYLFDFAQFTGSGGDMFKTSSIEIAARRNGRIMTVTKSILTISRDQSLQSTRTLILQQAGYTVSAALNDKDAIGFVQGPAPLDLVLMCHSVPEANRILLAAEIKKLRPRLPILMLYNGYDPTSANVDGSLHSLETPEALLDMIGFMTRNIGGTSPHQ